MFYIIKRTDKNLFRNTFLSVNIFQFSPYTINHLLEKTKNGLRQGYGFDTIVSPLESWASSNTSATRGRLCWSNPKFMLPPTSLPAPQGPTALSSFWCLGNIRVPYNYLALTCRFHRSEPRLLVIVLFLS